MSRDLKPCPFCGGTDLRQDDPWVQCKCGAEGPGDSDETNKRGRELWNARAAQAREAGS